MNEALTRVLATLTDPSAGPAIDDVETLTREYPFFVLPAVLALRHRSQEISEPLRQKLMNIIALNSPDPQAMFMLADVAYEDWAQFYPAASTGVTTNDAITKFLETYGHTDPREEALLERLIFNPAPDYSTLLAREQEQDMPEAPADPADNSQDALINSFILKHKDNESDLLPTAPSTHEEEPGPQTEATEAGHGESDRKLSVKRRSKPPQWASSLPPQALPQRLRHVLPQYPHQRTGWDTYCGTALTPCRRAWPP